MEHPRSDRGREAGLRRVARAFREVPPIVLAALLAAAIIGGTQAWRRGRTRVPVVGSGHIALLRERDAPEKLRYELAVVQREQATETALRVAEQVATWPDVIILGVSGSTDRPEVALATLARMAVEAENAAAGVVLVGFPEEARGHSDTLQRGFRDLCQPKTQRLCVEASQSLGLFREAVARAATTALERQQALRASLYR